MLDMDGEVRTEGTEMYVEVVSQSFLEEVDAVATLR
jgi:hypothetical protein